MKKLFFLVDVVLVMIFGYIGYVLYVPQTLSSTPLVVDAKMPVSQMIEKMSEQFESRDLLHLDRQLIKLYIRVRGYDTQLQSGTYIFNAHESISRVGMVKFLVRGPLAKPESSMTILEGWSNQQLQEYLGGQGIDVSQFSRLAQVSTYSEEFSFLKDIPSTATLDGFLFPDTYRVFTDVELSTVLQKMLQNFDNKISLQMRQDIEIQGKSLYNIIILASIIEKEVRTLDSKKKVAGIFYNRLSIGMPLQSDATINYITKSGRDRSTFEDLEIDSPYNTYKYKGLPPTPISNPGLDAIIAAIYPEKTEYFYFLTTPEGNIYFAKTHDEHVANKARYLAK